MKSNRGREILEKITDPRGLVTMTNPETRLAVTDEQDGDINISGWFITETYMPSHNMVVSWDAFSHDEGYAKFNGRVLAFHDILNTPVGEVMVLDTVKKKGIRGNIRVWKENDPLFLRAIREKVLNAFSISFAPMEWSFNEETEIVTVTKAELREVSIVNIGANPDALFVVRNALQKQTNNLIHLNERNNALDKKETNPDANDKFDATSFVAKQTDLETKYTSLNGLVAEIKTAQTQFAANLITKAELAERLEKMSKDVEDIRKEVETAKNQTAYNATKVAYCDYRSLITEFDWLTDENGNKLPKIAHKAYCLFQMPVDYDKMEAGYELRNLRNLHDAVIIADAMGRFKQRDRYSLRKSRLFTQLVDATAKFDKDVSCAMAGGNTGYGAEWLPEELSAEFNEILRVEPMLPSKFLTWNMPKGSSAKYPFQNGKAVVYKGGEALVDNAEEARKTNIATDVKTFTPTVFIGALVSSEELTEDTILDMVEFIRRELAVALLEGLESALINGDDSVTHFDNAGGSTPYAGYAVETAFKGLRKLGISNSRDIEDSSATTGVNSLELVNFTDAKRDMGIAGLRPTQCLYVTGIKGRTLVQNALFKEDALGVLAFMISGTLPTIDGTDVYVSGLYNESQDSAGVQTAGDVKHTSLCSVHIPSFRIAQRRGITLEFNKNIMTQQQQFVATARWDFGKVCASSIAPVSEMINAQHTA